MEIVLPERFKTTIIFAIVITSCLMQLSYGMQVKGVAPEFRKHYDSSSQTFTCISGQTVIPWGQVNDNYCDCADGSDEPGTSACYNGFFYCRNKGFKPVYVGSQFVDDGTCDCCDGSDESVVQCSNTCSDQGASELKALTQQLAQFESGAKIRETEFVKPSDALIQGWKSKAEQLKQQITDAEQLVAQQTELVTKLEQEEKEAQKIDAEKQRQKEEGEQKQQDQTQPGEGSAASNTAEDQKGQGEDHQQQQLKQDQTQPDGKIQADEQAKPDEQTQADEQQEQQAQAQPVPAKEEDSASNEVNTEEVQGTSDEDYGDDYIDAELTDDDGEDGDYDYEMNDEHIAAEQQLKDQQKAKTPKGTLYTIVSTAKQIVKRSINIVTRQYDEPQQPSSLSTPSKQTNPNASELTKARDAKREATSKLSKLKQQLQSNEKKLSQNYGPDNAFAGLADVCTELVQDKYTYKICLMGKAEQKEAGGSVSLGTFTGFNEEFNQIQFQNGQKCWQGPDRQLLVHLQCGSKTEVTQLEEPNRCEYEAIITTPVVCTTSIGAHLQQQIKFLKGEDDDEAMEQDAKVEL